LRSGLLDESQFEQFAAGIAELERRPAHLTQSAEDSSLDAWLEGDAYYRRPERSISYYNKGELLGIMLDLTGARGQPRAGFAARSLSMDEPKLREERTVFPDSDGVREAAEAVSHADLGWFFAKYVAGTEEIPWNDFFRSVGIASGRGKNTAADAGFTASRNFDGPMTVEGSPPAAKPSVPVCKCGDTILEINGNAAGQESSEEIDWTRSGDTITFRKCAADGSAERELKWKVGGREEITYELKDMDEH
jgi:predicted metalloprotease with PDZ domain